MTLTTAMIKELKVMTGAGILDCKRALEAADGDLQQAGAALLEKGLAQAAKKADRETGAGLVVVQGSAEGVCAVELDCETDFAAGTDEFKGLAHRIADQMLAAGSAAEPGASTEAAVQELVVRLGENVMLRRVERYPVDAATVVEGYIHAGDVEAGYAPGEGRIGVLIELGLGNPGAVDRQVVSSLARDLALHITASQPRYLAPDEIPAEDQGREQELCLLSQPYVKDDSLTVEQFVRQKGGKSGGAITVKRFARFEVGN